MKRRGQRFFLLGGAVSSYPFVRRLGIFLDPLQLSSQLWRALKGAIFGCEWFIYFYLHHSHNYPLPRSDWTLDVTHPCVDAEEGWQYAQSFDEPDDKWTAEMPLQLQRLMSSNGIVSAGFGGHSGRGQSLSSSSQSRPQPTWVRRKRWVRIMRRRLDIPPLAFLEPDGAMYHLDFDGSLIPYVEDSRISPSDNGEARELGAMSSTFLSSAQDYVARARYLVGNQLQDSETSGSAVEVRRAIAKVERATMELRQGILSAYSFPGHITIN